MRFIRRYWAPLLALGLIPLLITLAVLQLIWISEIGEKERFRLTQGLLAAAGQLSSAFQNEIGILPMVFQLEDDEIDRALASGDWSDFKERWDFWRNYALDPTLVGGIRIYHEAVPEKKATVWLWDGKIFAEDIQFSHTALFTEIVESKRKTGISAEPMELNADEEAYIISLSPLSPYWLIIGINRLALTESFIPLLAERYLYGKADYIFRIVDRFTGSLIYASDKVSDAIFTSPDLSYALLNSDFRLANHGIERLSDDGMKTMEDPNLGPAFGILRARRQAFSEVSDTDKRTELYLAPAPPPEYSHARWVLEAVHRKGSLADAVQSIKTRSAAISSGILAVLGAALIFLAYSTRRKQELAERQSEFIASVTHELKTPLAVIRSAADNLADGVVSDQEKTAQYGGMIRGESGRLSDMIDRLLAYARIGDSRAINASSIELDKLCERVLEQEKEALRAASFRTEIQLKPNIIIHGDKTALELAIHNLIINALKHARAGAFLGVSLRAKNAPKHARFFVFKRRGEAVLSIRDRGPGIPKNERRLIFEAFYRGQRARTKQTPGSGLGLNIVKRIIQAHGGSIKLESQGELGTAFVIHLPMENSHVQ